MLNKQAVPINFSQGVNTKPDPKQVPVGQFLSLKNADFDKIGLLKKRNGYGELSSLPSVAQLLTTFNDDLTALGSTLQSYSPASQSWYQKGSIQPVTLDAMPLIRNSLNQSQSDSAVSSNGFICTAYAESNGSATSYKYAVANSTTGQNVISPTALAGSSGTVSGNPRVFLLGNYFIIVYTVTITATDHLQYIAISTNNPTIVTSPADIAPAYIAASTLSWDGVVVGVNLYVAYNTTSGGQSIKMTYLSQAAVATGATPITPVTFAAQICTMMSMCADITVPSQPIIYASYYDAAGSTGYTLAVDQNLHTVLAPAQIIASGTILNIISAAKSGVCTSFYEVSNNYGYDSAIASHYVGSVTCTQAGVVGTPAVVIRSVGLASKAFILDSVIYFLSEYQSTYQPTYFLINGSASRSSAPIVVAKLGYQNGFFNASNATQSYLPTGLPNVSIDGSTVQFPYLFKDLIQSVSKDNTAITSSATNPIQTTNIYSQTGINLATVVFGTDGIDTAEIGQNLNITGGFLAAYDGYQTTEQSFFVYPDNVECTWSATGGSIHAQPDGATNTNAYWYQVTYEWTDNQGNIFRSAPSIPVAVTTTSNGTAGSITVNVPYLRLTYKTNVKIVIYRWSVGQQTYFQTTSITQPTLNSTTSDAVAYVDTHADASILGNNILYTTGGVVENVSAPASRLVTLFDNRVFLVSSEDDLIWFSKQVIPGAPVEMSDLFTLYAAPTTGAQGSTGKTRATSVMDDKYILFKKDAIYYVNGNGPDNTGSNNNYNGPIFITSTVGCSLQKSIAFIPNGLIFQSDKGFWLLGRDLSVSYIGAPVEEFTKVSDCVSANVIPETNQVRFTMDSGITLMYDYYVGQWGEFEGIAAVSSTLYQGRHSFINQYGEVFQEIPGLYLDGSNPVLLSFETSEFPMAGLQGYQRIFFFYLLGTYYSPHKLNVQIAYDFEPTPSQQAFIIPINATPLYGDDSVYGETSPFGGPGSSENWRVFTKKQRCQSFRILVSEIYDPTQGVSAGAGLTLSGLSCIVGLKKPFRPQPANTSVGAA